MSKIVTKKQTDHELFGQASSLPPHKLPTNGDALRLIRKYKYDFEGKFCNRDGYIRQRMHSRKLMP